MINVDIDLGRHTINVPYGMKKLLIGMIAGLDITQGNFKVHLGERIRGISQKGVSYIKLMPEFSAILIKAQPSGKDGRHVCTVYFRDMYKDQLSKLADILQKKVGQEDLVEDEIIVDDKKVVDDEVAQSVEVESAESLLAKQQRYLAENLILNTEMLTLITGDILEKKGTGWIMKKDLFSLLRKLKLDYPVNRLIGRLFSLGYLEKDPEQPIERSRLTPSACLLVNYPTVIKEDDAKILDLFESLKVAAADYTTIQKEQVAAVIELKHLTENGVWLEDKLAKITKIISQRVKENEDKFLEKKHELKVISDRITPRMMEANRRLEIMFSDLPE